MRKSCVFCNFKDKQVVLYEDSLCYAVISKNPINKHHVLIIPREHYEEFTKLPDKLVSRLFIVAKKISLAVKKACNPDAITYVFDDDFSKSGFNLVSHYKLHIIPRLKKDLSLMDWGPLRTEESLEARSNYARRVKKLLA
jgi:histidine triad (HIT) family protein